MKLNDAYNNNNEGNEATLHGRSANITEEQEDKLADMGDQIREYIQQITQVKENVPPPPSNIKPATSSNSSDKAVEEMNKRMANLESMMTDFCSNKENRGSGSSNNNNNKNKQKGNRRGPETRIRNMGAYCYSCGFNPIGKNHTSKTCNSRYKRSTHDDNATWTNRGDGNGSMVWPTKIHEDQKNHEAYAGKSAPTN